MLCIFLASGILVSILDRLFTLSGYRSYHLIDKSSTYRLGDMKEPQEVGIAKSWVRKATRRFVISSGARKKFKQFNYKYSWKIPKTIVLSEI